MAAFDQIRSLQFVDLRPNLYSVNTETDKICQTKKKKDMLDLENQKQSLADIFEYKCSWKFRKFHRKISVLESFLSKVVGLKLYYKRLQHSCSPVKFIKFLRTPFFTGYLRWLLLENRFRSSRERRLQITGKNMQLFDKGYFFCWLRMSPAVFEEL